jgi:hypothetical protein
MFENKTSVWYSNVHCIPLKVLCSEFWFILGWICYAEKTHGNWILPYISKVKSAQQVFEILEHNSGIWIPVIGSSLLIEYSHHLKTEPSSIEMAIFQTQLCLEIEWYQPFKNQTQYRMVRLA